jgi:hypothetical protein
VEPEGSKAEEPKVEPEGSSAEESRPESGTKAEVSQGHLKGHIKLGLFSKQSYITMQMGEDQKYHLLVAVSEKQSTRHRSICQLIFSKLAAENKLPTKESAKGLRSYFLQKDVIEEDPAPTVIDSTSKVASTIDYPEGSGSDLD